MNTYKTLSVFLLINMLENTIESTKKVMKITPLPQDVIQKYSDLPFHLILCGFVCFLGIF